MSRQKKKMIGREWEKFPSRLPFLLLFGIVFGTSVTHGILASHVGQLTRLAA